MATNAEVALTFPAGNKGQRISDETFQRREEVYEQLQKLKIVA